MDVLSCNNRQGATATVEHYYSETPCTWCAGCGNYGIWTAVRYALAELKLEPWQVCLCYDVGCHGNGSDKIQGYRLHGLHGRVIPLAAGAKLANMKIPVIAFGGDGATFSEGIGHLIHGLRSHYPITFVLHNNGNFALTTGQPSALTPDHNDEKPEDTLSVMDVVFSLQPTFVARSISGDIGLTTRVLKAAIQHRGFSFVEVLQACPTWNHVMTHERLLEVYFDANAKGHNPNDLEQGRALALDHRGTVACGILLQRDDVPDFPDRLAARKGVVTTCVEEVKKYDVQEYWGELL